MSDSPHVVLRCNKYISLQHIKSYHTRALSRVKAATVTFNTPQYTLGIHRPFKQTTAARMKKTEKAKAIVVLARYI